MCFLRGFFWCKAAFTHNSFCTNTLEQRWFLHGVLLYRDAFYTDICTKKCFLAHVSYKEMGAFRLGHFWAEKILHGQGWKHRLGECSNHSGIRFPVSCLLLYTKNTFREMLLHASALRHKSFFTEMMLQMELVDAPAFAHSFMEINPRRSATLGKITKSCELVGVSK